MPYESPYASPNHLLPVVAPDWTPQWGMTREHALAIPAVSRARLVICSTVARVPLVARRGGTILTGTDRPTWIDRTDGPVSPYHRMLGTVDDLLFYGWSLWAVERDSLGRVIAADRLPWDAWQFDAEGTITWSADDGTPAAPVDPDSVVLIPGSTAGILSEAVPALEHARDLLAAAGKAAAAPAAHIDLHQTNDAPMTEAEINRLVSRWVAARRGENGGVAFSSSGIEVRELGAYDAHLLVEGRNAAAVDIARATGVPASVLDATTPTASLNYETREGRAAELVDYCLTAFMAPIAARLGMDDVVPRGTSVEFDVDAVFSSSAVAPPDDDNTPPRPAATPTPAPRKVTPDA